MTTTWADGTTTARLPSQLVAAELTGLMGGDIDPAVQWQDDPLGIGFAAPCHPAWVTAQSGFVANRAVFMKAISGGLVNFLHWHVQVTGGNVDFGIYANSGVGAAARPTTRLWSLGGIACPATGAQVTTTVNTPVVVKARQHWFAFAADNITVQLYRASTMVTNLSTPAEGWLAQILTGAYPLPADATGLTVGGVNNFPFVVGRRT